MEQYTVGGLTFKAYRFTNAHLALEWCYRCKQPRFAVAGEDCVWIVGAETATKLAAMGFEILR